MSQVLLENRSSWFFGRTSFLDFINVTTMYDTRTSSHDWVWSCPTQWAHREKNMKPSTTSAAEVSFRVFLLKNFGLTTSGSCKGFLQRSWGDGKPWQDHAFFPQHLRFTSRYITLASTGLAPRLLLPLPTAAPCPLCDFVWRYTGAFPAKMKKSFDNSIFRRIG